MDFEESVEPLGGYFLGKLVPLTKLSGLHVPGEAQEKGGRMYVVKVGPKVEGLVPGDRVIPSPHWKPVVFSKLDGYNSTDESLLFLFPADQIIAKIREDVMASES